MSEISTISQQWFEKKILTWYKEHGRHDLPWKKSMDAYRVWVSEIMLQQTQVATVVPYFAKFMKSFPTVSKLARASLDNVLAHWAGLGYYARGRNLHKTAQIIIEQYQGHFPSTVEELVRLPGIGLSTAGAIVAQAFDKRATICDGNVKRVLSRIHCIDGSPSEKKVETTLWALAEFYTPNKHVADYTQAIMDIGATLCTRSDPNCLVCPLQKRCRAFIQGKQAFYPQKKISKPLPTRRAFMLCALNINKEILLFQRSAKGIWGGLWSLPEFSEKSALDEFIQSVLGIKRFTLMPMPEMKHTFTHFHLDIMPWLIHIPIKSTLAVQQKLNWVSAKNIKQLGLPAPIKKILKYDIILENVRTV